MYANDQTADAVRDGDGANGETTTDGPGGAHRSGPTAPAVADAPSVGPMPNEVVLESLTDRAIVRIEVGGEVGPHCPLSGSTATYDDDVAVCRIDGVGEREGVRFSGTMIDLEIVEGDVEVALDLHREDPAARGEPTRLSVHAQGSTVDYGFAVSGALERESGADAPGSDAVSDQAARGTVTGSGVDEYVFTGEVTEFDASTDEVLVMVNDRVVDPDALA